MAIIGPARLAPLAARIYRLGSALRSKTVMVPLERIQLMLEAVACLPSATLREVYWCGRATLCSSREHFGVYDECFFAIFDEADPTTEAEKSLQERATPEAGQGQDRESGGAERIGAAGASTVEVLRHRGARAA